MQETTSQEKASEESSKGPKVQVPKWGTVNIGDNLQFYTTEHEHHI